MNGGGSSADRSGMWREREEALAAAQESVTRLRFLAGTDPSRRPELADALTSLGIELGGFGRRREAWEAAEESVGILSGVVGAGAEMSHVAALGVALDALAVHRAGLGKREDALLAAEQAVHHLRIVDECVPGACRPYLAMALRTVSARLGDLGRDEEALAPAREAADHFRDLARDGAAYRVILASVLVTVSDGLARLGHDDEALPPAEEAVDLVWRSTGTDHVDWLVQVGEPLHKLALRLADLGRLEEAAVHLQHAVRARRTLVESLPDADEAELAQSLRSLALVLGALGRRDEALRHARDAADHYRRATDLWPGTYPGAVESCERLVRELSGTSGP